jgi:non-heme chloroperoxidase
MLKTDTNCGDLSIEVFDGIRASVLMDRSHFSKVLTRCPPAAPKFAKHAGRIPALGHATRFQERLRLQRGSEEGRHADPDLYGDDDQIVPIGASAHASAKLIGQWS